MKKINIMEIGGFKVGHAQNEESGTGCTVFLFDKESPAGVDLRGGGCASREVQLLDPLAAAKTIHGILLSGGSAYGLDAAGGVMEYLEERKIGFPVGNVVVPLICQSCVFDLMVGQSNIRPDKKMAYEACENATKEKFVGGNVGAGTGCSVGKVLGTNYAMKAGIGSYAVEVGEIKIGAVVALNALGDIFDREENKQIAGLLSEDKKSLRNSEKVIIDSLQGKMPVYGNTTLAVIITNVELAKAELCKISGMAHNGYGRAIAPVHTTADGDTIYTVSVGKVNADVNVVGSLAAHVIEKAILDATYSAKAAYGLISVNELNDASHKKL